jgi:hypothetical protein
MTHAVAAEVRRPAREVLHVVAEVTALDPATRDITLAGPLGGEISATVDAQVKNLAQIKVGDMVELGYYESVTLSAHRKGVPGAPQDEPPGEAPQKRATVRVLSVDVGRNLLVVEGANGKLFSTRLERPEHVSGLATLRPGDNLEVVMTRAVAVSLTPAKAGAPPTTPPALGTLVIDRGDVVKQVGNTLLIRNQRGRTFKVTVDPRFKFVMNGQLRSVYDLQPGIRLSRTSFRVMDIEYVPTP